jgi:hypothetical protein
MASFSNAPLPELVASARALYTGARDTPAAHAALADYGYTAADLDAGLDLVEEVEALQGTQAAEYAEQYAATEAAAARHAEVDALYTRHRRLARLAHPRGSDGYRGLGLAGRAPGSEDRLLETAGTFYRSLADTPVLAAGVRTLDATAVADGLARVEAARAAADAQSRETGEAQRATRLRDDATVRLRAHAAELAVVARLALADAPQLREALGLIERGS